MDMRELVEQLRNPGDDGLPETIYDDLLSAHDHEVSTRDAKINQLTEDHTASLAEIEALKAKNWDLSNLLPPVDGDTDGSQREEETVEVSGIDSLFEHPLD